MYCLHVQSFPPLFSSITLSRIKGRDKEQEQDVSDLM